MPNNLRQASQRAMQDANLGTLDGFGSERSEFDFEPALTAVEQTMGGFVQRVHNNLNETDSIFTGSIADIRVERDGNDIIVTANRHLLYQDKGVNGSEVKLYDTPFSYKDKRPPIEVLQAWADAKELNVFYVQDKIFKEGIPPKNVYSKELPQLESDILEAAADAIVINIIENF